MGRRLAALLGALLLIAAAVVVRNVLDSDGEVTLGRRASPVVCDPLVIDACREAFDGRTVTEEEPGQTLDRLLSPDIDQRDVDPFVWVTAEVWIEILESERKPGSPAFTAGQAEGPLAVSPLLLATRESWLGCPEVTWKCLAAEAEEGAGVRLGLDSPDSTLGLLARGELAAGLVGRSDFAINDLDAARILNRVNGLEGAENARGPRDAFTQLVVEQGSFEAAATIESARQAAINRGGFEATVPTDVSRRITIVAVPIGDADGRSGDLAEVLVGRGWRSEAADATDGRPPVSAGVLQALRTSAS